ncbi:small ribosomal subunit protein mS39 [Tribolium castaneum]|uniref:Small ribosomal subunit protein mS39 n=1 Tax=Tribolium castaneum TaxID=7070 RepID=D6WAL8_TRICA|nr:PREDICTED: protein PTCD3 homolog, mitochondrial [Tribolium castaneum]EEZ97978.1 Protein PTCD3 homolog, mitochondrial-like Protein [Tribolium castaneum]|eukprot:XP_974709.1 PREDICTED: protein PTCD3 homolog, mitochondrial [Tribolium castaneum]
MMNISKVALRSRVSRVKLTSQLAGLATTPDEKIEIPKRVPRGPTDILRALESTVGRDPTAAHYKYHDDPYLIPLSNNGKRVFALSQEAGRKAAHWIRREHADLFQHREADPTIEAFVPPMVFDEKSEVAVTDLQKLIKTAQVSDAVVVYKLLKEKGAEVAPELEQGLLELVCYQNCEDGLSDEFIEEKWFKQSQKGKEKLRKTWKDGDFAEQLFMNLPNKTPEAYCAIIQGMAKYYQVDRAVQLFEEAQQNNIPLNTNTYNSLISAVNIMKESFDLRWSLVAQFLNQMKDAKLKPNLGTLNAILAALSSMGNPVGARKYALMTLSQFRELGIEPSLGSWSLVLNTFYKDRGPVSTILHDIINLVENKEHQIRDLKDVHFFVTAMETCRFYLNDVSLAKRIDRLLHHGENYNLIGDSYKESVYYRHYFALLCANLPIEEFMNDVYYKLIPHIYVPEPALMAEVLNQVDVNGAIEYVPKLWSDLVIFDHAHRENLIEMVLNSMTNNEELLTPELNEKFATVGWDIFSRFDDQDSYKVSRMKVALSGDFLGKILLLLARNKEFEKACCVMEKLDRNQQSIAGVPKVEALDKFVDLCIEEKAPSRAIACIQYCVDCGYGEANAMAVRLHKKLTLDEVFLDKLTKIVGDISLAGAKDSV